MTAKNINIVDRVVERIKEQPLGDLITEEDLYDIVKEAIPKAFFEPVSQTTFRGSYNERTEVKEPVIVSALRDSLKEHVEAHIRTWFSDNIEKVDEFWKGVMDAGLVEYVQKIQREATTRHLEGVLHSLISNLNNERMRAGLPMMNVAY
jgi:hypothetical protein